MKSKRNMNGESFKKLMYWELRTYEHSMLLCEIQSGQKLGRYIILLDEMDIGGFIYRYSLE